MVDLEWAVACPACGAALPLTKLSAWISFLDGDDMLLQRSEITKFGGMNSIARPWSGLGKSVAPTASAPSSAISSKLNQEVNTPDCSGTYAKRGGPDLMIHRV